MIGIYKLHITENVPFYKYCISVCQKYQTLSGWLTHCKRNVFLSFMTVGRTKQDIYRREIEVCFTVMDIFHYFLMLEEYNNYNNNELYL